MTLRLIDGFDYYDYDHYYAISGANGWIAGLDCTYPTDDTAFAYGKAQTLGGNSSNSQYKIRTARGRWTSERTYVIGQRMRIPPGEGNMRFGVRDSFSPGGEEQWFVMLDYTGSITLYRNLGNSFQILAKTLSGAFVANQWFYIEIKWKPAYTNAFFEVRINTVPVLSMTTAWTAYSPQGLVYPAVLPGFDGIFYACSSGARPWAQDDFYLLDNVGEINNDYLGNVRVKYQKVIGQEQTDWDIGGTAPAPSNWQSVLNVALDDAQYVSSSTPGDQDFYQVNPNVSAPFVHGFEVSGAYKQDDATQRVVRNAYQTSMGSIRYGHDNYTNQSYTFSPDIFEINPDTGLAFTQAEINSLLIGPNVVA